MYRAPEQVEPSFYRDFPIGEKVDIFALGVVAYILCFKKAPFETSTGVISGSFAWPEIPSTSDEFHSLITNMLSVEPTKRPSA